MGHPRNLFIHFRSFQTTNKNCRISRIRTWIVGEEREHACHLNIDRDLNLWIAVIHGYLFHPVELLPFQCFERQMPNAENISLVFVSRNFYPNFVFKIRVQQIWLATWSLKSCPFFSPRWCSKRQTAQLFFQRCWGQSRWFTPPGPRDWGAAPSSQPPMSGLNLKGLKVRKDQCQQILAKFCNSRWLKFKFLVFANILNRLFEILCYWALYLML